MVWYVVECTKLRNDNVVLFPKMFTFVNDAEWLKLNQAIRMLSVIIIFQYYNTNIITGRNQLFVFHVTLGLYVSRHKIKQNFFVFGSRVHLTIYTRITQYILPHMPQVCVYLDFSNFADDLLKSVQRISVDNFSRKMIHYNNFCRGYESETDNLTNTVHP